MRCKALPGIRKVFVVKGGETADPWRTCYDGVAIVADKWHQANKALEKLQVKWDEGRRATHQHRGLRRQARGAVEEAGRDRRQEGRRRRTAR